jgi:uncharacterized membrane protein YkvI
VIRSGLKWMFLILGTMIGAGYASGRELWQFFGQESALAILLFTILFIISTYGIMAISYEKKAIHYLPVLRDILGEKMSRIYDILIFFYLFTTTVVMLAGGGATLEVLGIPYWGGVLFIGVLLVLLFVKGYKGMIAMTAIILPVLIILLVSVLYIVTRQMPNVLSVSWNNQSNWPSAFTFTALNVVSLVAVLGAVGGDIKTKGEIWIASIGSGLILGGISFFYNQSLIQVAKDIVLYEIPLYALIKSYPYILTIIMSGVLWFAIYTTAASGILGIVTRIKKVIKLPMWALCLCIILIMVPLTTVGFSTLISILYPIYGIFNLYFLAAIILYPILIQEKNGRYK